LGGGVLSDKSKGTFSTSRKVFLKREKKRKKKPIRKRVGQHLADASHGHGLKRKKPGDGEKRKNKIWSGAWGVGRDSKPGGGRTQGVQWNILLSDKTPSMSRSSPPPKPKGSGVGSMKKRKMYRGTIRRVMGSKPFEILLEKNHNVTLNQQWILRR